MKVKKASQSVSQSVLPLGEPVLKKSKGALAASSMLSNNLPRRPSLFQAVQLSKPVP